MRSTGEVMASAADLPDRVREGRAAPRAGPCRRRASPSSRSGTATRRPRADRGALAGLGFELVATTGRRGRSRRGLDVDEVGKVGEEPARRRVVDLIRGTRCNLVVNTPQGSGARADGYLIREAALVARVPCITTISGAAAAVHAIANARAGGDAVPAGATVVSASGGNH